MSRPANIRNLKLECLNDRIVPATFNLTAPGSTALVNGAWFQQVSAAEAGTGLNTFLKIDAPNGSSERGYNSNFRPVQFNEATTVNGNHAIKLSDVPLVSFNGGAYREFCLDIKQKNGQPNLSLDEIRIFTSTDGNLHNYNSASNTLGGQSPVYNLDAGSNNNVSLKDNPGLAEGDMLFFVPDSVFVGVGPNDYVHLYSKMGMNNKMTANNGAEEWSIRTVTVPPPPPPPSGPSSISGRVFLDENQNNVIDEGTDFGLGFLTVTLTDGIGGVWTTQTSNEPGLEGTYNFADLLPGTYTVTVDQDPGYLDGAEHVGSAGGTAGAPGTDSISSITLGAGIDAFDYNFTEVSFPS